MARLPAVPLNEWDADLKALVGGAEGVSNFEAATLGVMAHNPRVLAAMLRFHAARAEDSLLQPRLRELIRLRVAFHNQCRSCMAVRYQSGLDDGVTEGLVCSLERPQEASDLTREEKAALAYADQASLDHFSIDDETFSKLGEHFTPAAIVELGVLVASCIGFGRLAASLHMIEALPAGYQTNPGAVAPWSNEAIAI